MKPKGQPRRPALNPRVQRTPTAINAVEVQSPPKPAAGVSGNVANSAALSPLQTGTLERHTWSKIRLLPPLKTRITSPPRADFLRRKAIVIAVAYLAIVFASQATQPEEYTSVLFSTEAVPIVTRNKGNLTLGKITARFIAVLLYCVRSYLLVECYSSFASFVVVPLGIKDVSLYGPHFEPISEAYNERQFWG